MVPKREFCKKCHLWDEVWENIKGVVKEIKGERKERCIYSAFIAIIITKDSILHRIALAQDYYIWLFVQLLPCAQGIAEVPQHL